MRSLIVILLTLACAAAGASAQRPDSLRLRPAPAVDTASNTALRSPISPRRAFFYSFVAPGYSQSVLGRHKAAAAFLVVESISLVMIRESAADVREARRFANDTTVLSYVTASGSPSVQVVAPLFGDAEIRTRRAHVEDWIALLVANHLFAGADAFVAANLWDVPARLGLRALPGGRTAVVASLKLK